MDALPWQEYGLAGLVLGFVLVTGYKLIRWVLEASRSDVKAATAEAARLRDEFVLYLMGEGSKSTAAINLMQQTLDHQHREVMAELRRQRGTRAPQESGQNDR